MRVCGNVYDSSDDPGGQKAQSPQISLLVINASISPPLYTIY